MSSCNNKSIICTSSKLKLPSLSSSSSSLSSTSTLILKSSDSLVDDLTVNDKTIIVNSTASSASVANETNEEDCKENVVLKKDFSGLRSQTKFICPRTYYVSGDHNYSRFKPRSSCEPRNEYRMARGGISNDRGRGGGAAGGGGSAGGGNARPRAFKKSVDRDSHSDGYSRPKFQEPLKNHENKYYDDKRTNEDSRISKLLRRLCREEDYDHFLTLCKQLQEGICAHENQRYIKRNLDIICESLFDLLHNGPSMEAKNQIAKCLGRIGYVAEQDFKKYMEWVFNKYSCASEYKDSNNIKCLLMRAFGETLKLDAESPKLKEYSMTMMTQLQSVLEDVVRQDLLIATVDSVLLMIESYPESFNDHFRNTVDILVGWHIDSFRQKSVAAYASRSLQRLRSFWIADLPFTLTLLGQFLEDMENYDEELSLPNSGRSTPGSGGDNDKVPCPRDCLLRSTAVVAVFNTVIRCIQEHLSPNLTPSVQWSFLMDCLSKMLKMVVKAIELDDGNEIINSNDAGLSQDNMDSLIQNMKNINISQKNIDTLLKNLNKNDEVNEESLIKLIKCLNIKKNDKKNGKPYDKDAALTLSKEKEESLINLVKSMDLKMKRNSDLSEEKEELIVVANECTCLLLGLLQSRVSKSRDLLYKFIDIQLQHVWIYWDDTIVSMLTIISKVIKEVSANLPLDFVHTLLGKNSVLTKLRFRRTVIIQNAVLDVYHSLLSLKNIPLLQEAYRYILADLENAFKVVVPITGEPLVSDNPFTETQYQRQHAEIVVIFLLRALSDIANASNSIIGMWALKPSILELLAVKLKPQNPALATESPLLQYHILFLLYSHCSRYNHFVPSSILITGTSSCCSLEIFPCTLEVPTVSPTSGHLSIILNLIANTIENKKTPDKTLLLMLEWIKEIYAQAENYMELLSKTDECKLIISSLLVCGASTNHKIAKAVCKNLDNLVKTKQVYWPEEIYSNIVDLAILHLTCCDKSVRESYRQLLMNIPLNIVLPSLNKAGLLSDCKKIKGLENYSSEALVISQRLHMRSNNSELQAHHFKTYMAFLLQENYFDNNCLSEIFSLSWPTIFDNPTMSKMYELGLSNLSFLYFWGGFEAAQHCVINKLRTPLGKPQETFTTIEDSLKQLAREISNVTCLEATSKKTKNLDQLLHEHTRVRSLVEFLEHLERVIHNAAEGCAVALLPHSKPVRNFFHTNRSTCREWLNRIRLALCVVSLHAGLATNALRNGQRLLEDLSAASNTQGPEFERATLCVARAMVLLGEAEALQGLYMYTKEKDRKFVWLKAAMEEAAAKFESAAENYRTILEDKILARSKEDPTNGEIRSKNDIEDSQVVVFCMERLSKCYHSLGAWKELEDWKIRETEILEQDKMSNNNLRKQMFENIAPQQATCLRKFEEMEELSLVELSNWTLLDEKARTNWSCTKTMSECSNTLTNIALRLNADDSTSHNIFEDIKKCHRVAARTMEEGLRNVPSEYLNSAILLQYSAAGLMDLAKNSSRCRTNVFELSEVENVDQLSSSTLTQVLWWSDYFRRANRLARESASEVDSLRLHVARSARKEGNFNLAQRELGKYFASERGLATPSNVFCDIVEDIVSGVVVPAEVVWTKDNMKAFRETSKLLMDMEKNEEALKVCCITALGISKSIVAAEQDASVELREVGTRVLLTLGKWIQQDANVDNNPQLEELLCFESLHNDGLMDKLFGKTTELIPPSDVIVGKLVQLGVNQCPDLPTAWSNFAGWCYKWGRKIVDNSSSGLLTDIDKTNIQSLLPMDITDTDFNTVLTILGQKNRVVPEDEGDIDTNDINTSETIENLLRSVPILSCASSEHLGMLVDIWRQAQSRIYAYYELSANAYFQYLQLAKDTNDCETITATLRLLRLVVKHASELQNVLESGLSTTPTGPWKEIIPQLFSRLSHPECYVRTRVSELLCRVAENSPHLITFPAVVGAVSCGQKNFEGATYEKNSGSDDGPSEVDYFLVDDNDYAQDANQGFMDACFAQLTDCLSNRIPDSVDQVKVLVRELRRITLLWDELWLATLCQHHSEITKRFEQLELEVQKVQDNIWLTPEEKDKLIAEKHRIILKPIVFILENLLAMTSVTAETPHEKNFQEKFGPYIEKVIEKLKNPKNPAKPLTAALTLKQLESKLAQKVLKRAYSLSMSDISPTLAKFKNTCIAMPGICTKRMVTIKSVDNHVQILPTKTKPKKLIFRGSDGQVYTYLFKGLEDLHLDERIMQFLSICNTMMSKNSDDSGKKVYRARHYSVIPLGPRSGLIQWVDGVTPLFALYKRWQQRESAMANKSSNSTVLRPSELFYSKLTPLLKERNIGINNRKEWPLPILKQVLAELMAETPKDLLAKEIWCNSLNAGSWWQATKNYSYSVAVMSIIGYIIGLGDRHLDNVLVDLNTGEVVHIDYNVCFEKGKTLRVPEKVPFRMTPNIKTALGVTGVEGIFRLACEHTLRVMRRGRETLLTLLEAFVYDPLVDWRAGADGNTLATYGACQARARCNGFGRKQLEAELTAAMFAVRIAEMKAEWLANKEELGKSFPAICHRLSRWIEACEASRQCQESLQDCHRQLAVIKEAQAMGRSHTLYSVAKRYNAFKSAKDILEKAKLGLEERIDECQKQMNSHNMALSTVRGPQLSHWLSEISSQKIQEDHLVFDLVKEFLQNAGQSQMIVQCEQSENELTQLAVQQSMLLRNCLDLLSQYAAIYNLYPLSYVARHRTVAYHGWAKTLLHTGTVEACHEVLAQIETHFTPVTATNPKVQRTIAFSYHVQNVLSETNDKMNKAYEAMMNQGLQDGLARIDKAFIESKTQIAAFLKREKGADKALECINISLLCSLNKKYLMMEGAAKCAGECLVDLTSREGDWFLDEMRLMSSLIAELISLIPENHKSNNDPKISLVIKCLKSADNIHKGLQELNYNFHTIILPEATKTIITEEPTVMQMINELDEIIASTGLSLLEILEQLEIHLRFTIMEMESPQATMQLVVDALRIRFEALLSRPSDLQEINQEETLSPGQMLLMGFNGLFEKLQMEGYALINTLGSLEIPSSWKKIDQIREAKEMAAPIFKEEARKILDDIFLIKRLHTIQKFFSMCREISYAFRGETTSFYEGPTGIYNDEQLNKPVRLFTADYVSRQLLGITSQSLGIALCFLLQRMGLNVTTEIEQRDIGAESKVLLDELCRKVIDMALKRGFFSSSVLAQASTLSNTLETTWRRKQSAKAMQQSLEVARASVQRLQLQLTAHYWLHEDFLLVGPSLIPLNRQTFMLELRKTAAGLSNLQARVNEAREQQQNLVTSAGQRLKWAAGANPALSEVMAAFDNAVLTSCEKLTHMANISAAVVNTCNTILHYEVLRTRTQEGLAHDSNFVKLVKCWEESCTLTMNMTITVSQVEESLVGLLQIGSDNHIDANSLRQTEKLISDVIVETQKKTQEHQDALVNNQQALREQVVMLQSIIADHHKLMVDVRMLLRSMAKQENIVGLQEFLMNYRSCTESLSATVKELESENLDPMKAAVLKMELEVLAVKTPALYDELLSFANETTNEQNVPEFSFNKAKLIRQDSVCFSPRKGITPARDPTTGKAVQERNAYALNVWRRVRMKLEGRDPNANRKYTTSEQVEYVIREAQSTENLALLYEGWTPWV